MLKYFKPSRKDERKDAVLPNPHGPLSSEVPPGAIEVANQKVSKTIQPSSGSTSSRGPYSKLMPAQRLLIGK